MSLLGRSIEIVKAHGLVEYMVAIRRYLLWHPIAGEIWWHVNRLISPGLRVIKTFGGVRILVDTSKKGIHRELSLYGYHEHQSTRIFKDMLPAGASVVDIGANIGYYALIEAQVAQKVYAIEPEPQNLEFLRKNIELNSYVDRIEVHQLAISDTAGKAWLCISDLPNQHRLLPKSDLPRDRCIEVETSTLDKFMKDREVNAIRMDLEGAEWLVLRGMNGVLRRNDLLVLFIEVHPRLMEDYGGDARQFLQLLLDYGFRISCITLFRPPSLFSIQRYVKPRSMPWEQLIELRTQSGYSLHEKYVTQIIEKSVSYGLFLERSREWIAGAGGPF